MLHRSIDVFGRGILSPVHNIIHSQSVSLGATYTHMRTHNLLTVVSGSSSYAYKKQKTRIYIHLYRTHTYYDNNY